ncbi:hypothetical protein CC77DRAFT_1018061 [Alternaria alternata]|uniref:Uncharacterized protein n=2 Tax=Alternaria alternata complex TaxID=187734 RepID=A0A177DUR5_ALTAL|nr:hypothetical protein CC77DRAFT_1018061 [Alternaria alternata]OAG23238.1 hypothetical protein CC77DRAFT_1018061 [Alternaria alternata]RYN16165.1 hypothetical protein AA0115_g12500 [Alternaria tenuissima]RYN52546.1 hypothetical protein AA0118_g9942 [Alternaria tenuissima]
MGIPYSRQINAAFEQVTPLVAAGFKVLRTTRDISILLAVIQVLTVFLLGLILIALVVLLYCVNPDLEEERQAIITPWLRYFAGITLWSVLRTLLSLLAVAGLAGAATWHFFLAKQWVEDVEYEGNVDADKALEDLDDDAQAEGGGNGGNKGKGKGKK